MFEKLKTIEWLRRLPEPYGELAASNFIAAHDDEYVSWHESEYMSDAINSFSWARTPQGGDYWSRVCESYKAYDNVVKEERRKIEEQEYEEKRRQREIEAERRRVIYSSSMWDMLQTFSNSGCRVSRIITRSDYWSNAFANYITTRRGMLSYLPAGREHRVNENGKWSRDGRQEMRPAKLARKLMTEEGLGLVDESDFEKFANNVKSYLGIVGDEDGEGKTLTLRIVEGEDLRRAYSGRNYSNVLGGDTNLHGSCMRYDECQKFLDIFVVNKNVIKLLIAEDAENKILGRALLWTFTDGTKGMDTIYGSDVVMTAFKNWAIDNDYVYKSNQSCHHHTFNMKSGEDLGDCDSNDLAKEVQLDVASFEFYPYLDSLYLLNETKKILHQSYDNHYDKSLRVTGGRWEDFDDDDDDYVTLENGDRVHQDDAIYLDYRCAYGRTEGYYHVDDCCRDIDGDWRHEEDVEEVDGDYYTKGDDRIVYVNSRNEYCLLDDTVNCEHDDELIHIDDARELHDGTYVAEEYAERCVVDDEYYDKDNMVQHNGEWVALCNEETYLETLKEKQNEEEREAVIA